MEPFIGQIIMFGGNFAPRGWAKCEGQLMPISSHSALFSILGTTYGGDGRTTFALPDLRGRVPIQPGTGPGLSTYDQGPGGGSEITTLSVANLPSHNHPVNISDTTPDQGNPAGALLGHFGSNPGYTHSGSVTGQARSDFVGHTGGGQSFSHVQPYACVQFIIALEGVYPSRN